MKAKHLRRFLPAFLLALVMLAVPPASARYAQGPTLASGGGSVTVVWLADSVTAIRNPLEFKVVEGLNDGFYAFAFWAPDHWWNPAKKAPDRGQPWRKYLMEIRTTPDGYHVNFDSLPWSGVGLVQQWEPMAVPNPWDLVNYTFASLLTANPALGAWLDSKMLWPPWATTSGKYNGNAPGYADWYGYTGPIPGIGGELWLGEEVAYFYYLGPNNPITTPLPPPPP